MSKLSTQEARVYAGGRRALDHMVRLGLVEGKTVGRGRCWDARELDEGLRQLRAARALEVEMRTPAPRRCVVDGCERRLANRNTGLCAGHYKRHLRQTDPMRVQVERANGQLRRGVRPSPSPLSPYRVLARTCRLCGVLNTTPSDLIYKDSGRLPRCSGCSVRYVTERHKRLMKEDAGYRQRYQANANVLSRAHYARKQIETSASATKNYYEWTGPELEIVAREDLTARAAPLMLGRTAAAVQMQRHLLRVDPRKINLAGIAR